MKLRPDKLEELAGSTYDCVRIESQLSHSGLKEAWLGAIFVRREVLGVENELYSDIVDG